MPRPPALPRARRPDGARSLVVAAALLVTACGDDAGTDAASGPAAVDAPPPPPEPVPGAFEIPGLSAQRPRPRLGWPVESVHVTSSFGWRVDPVTGRGTRLHRGMDFRGVPGDLVLSIGAGEVEFVGHDPLLGNLVVIDHGEGLLSYYGHLLDVLVVTGMPVDRGAAIGLVGNTGRSEAPHLHLTIKLDGVAIDPLDVLGEPLHRPAALVPAPSPPAPAAPAPDDAADGATGPGPGDLPGPPTAAEGDARPTPR